jgi:hypothetical protein
VPTPSTLSPRASAVLSYRHSSQGKTGLLHPRGGISVRDTRVPPDTRIGSCEERARNHCQESDSGGDDEGPCHTFKAGEWKQEYDCRRQRAEERQLREAPEARSPDPSSTINENTLNADEQCAS